jgi:F0F1-type ATP synthase assembly protein I
VGSPPKDGRTLLEGYAWAQRAMSIALQLVIPAGIGFWLDGRLHTAPWLLVVGTVIGFASMLMELVRITRPNVPSDRPTDQSDSSKT